MGKVYNNPGTGAIFVENSDGHLVWSTDRRPLNLLPEAQWITIPNQQIVFPNFNTFVNYGYIRYNTSWFGGGVGDSCQTILMIEPEERTLPDITLGTLPAGCNYIDVRVQLSRTVNPGNFLDQPVVPLIQLNTEVALPGGSCLVEATAIWRRLFEIILVGSSIRLRRHQSVFEPPRNGSDPNSGNQHYRYAGIYSNGTRWSSTNTISQPGIDPWDNTSRSGWLNYKSMGDVVVGNPAAQIDQKNFSANSPSDGTPTIGAKGGGRSQQCSISHNISFASTYAGQIVIRPGYIPD